MSCGVENNRALKQFAMLTAGGTALMQLHQSLVQILF